jgi:hypothetical protein
MIYAFNKALWRRRPGAGLLVHGDRSVQYASADFRHLLEKTDCVQSMSRNRNCWDNTVAESFFHTLKTQLTHHMHFRGKNEAELALFNYIEAYYNRRRRHSAIGTEPRRNSNCMWKFCVVKKSGVVVAVSTMLLTRAHLPPHLHLCFIVKAINNDEISNRVKYTKKTTIS